MTHLGSFTVTRSIRAFSVVLFISLSLAVARADEIKDKLEKAKSDFQASIVALRKPILDALDAQIAAAQKNAAPEAANGAKQEHTQAGAEQADDDDDADPIVALTSERDEFASNGVPPSTTPELLADYQKGLKAAFDRLERAYALAGKSWTDKAMHDEAKAAAREIADLKATDDLFEWTDLACMINLKTHASGDAWSRDGRAIVAAGGNRGVLRIPTSLPAEYALEITAARTRGDSDLQIALKAAGDARGLLVLGGYGGATSGLALLDGKDVDANPTKCTKPVFKADTPATLLVNVRKSGIRVESDGNQAFEWDGSGKLALPEGLKKDAAGPLTIVASGGSAFRIDSIRFKALKTGEIVRAAPRPGPGKAAAGANPLSNGAKLTGTLRDKHGRPFPITAEVQNDGKTLTIRRYLQKHPAWVIECALNGTSFSVRNITVNDRRVTIEDRAGGGSVQNGVLNLRITGRYHWANKRNVTFDDSMVLTPK